MRDILRATDLLQSNNEQYCERLSQRRGHYGEGTSVQAVEAAKVRGHRNGIVLCPRKSGVYDQLILDGLRVALLGLFFSLEIRLRLLAGSTLVVFALSLQSCFLCFVFPFVSQLGLLIGMLCGDLCSMTVCERRRSHNHR